MKNIIAILNFSIILFVSSATALADFYVIPVGGKAKIDSADVVHAYTLFNTSTSSYFWFDRILSDGTFVNDWQIPSGKKLVITNLTISPTVLSEGSRVYGKLWISDQSSSYNVLQGMLVPSGQDYNYNFGVGIVVDSELYVGMKSETGATSGGWAYIDGYLIDN